MVDDESNLLGRQENVGRLMVELKHWGVRMLESGDYGANTLVSGCVMIMAPPMHCGIRDT